MDILELEQAIDELFLQRTLVINQMLSGTRPSDDGESMRLTENIGILERLLVKAQREEG